MKYLKKHEILNTPIPIMSLEFQHLPEKVLEETYNEKNFGRRNYQALGVEQGRLELDHSLWPKEFSDFTGSLYETIRFISLELLRKDPIRYPVHCDLEEWFDNHFIRNPGIAIFPIMDFPGFFMPWHLDNRLMVISGMINIQDNCVGTIFQTNNKNWKGDNFKGPKSDLVYQSSTKKYNGTAWLNTDLTWHAVPLITEPRKILLFNVFF